MNQMADLSEVGTLHLLLRRPRAEDWECLGDMHSDPRVMDSLGGIRGEEETRKYLATQIRHWEAHGFGWWIAVDRATSEFAGRGGIRYFEIEGHTEVEVGYAFMSRFWGQGYATELATAAVEAGLGLGINRLVAVAQESNTASRRVLEKVGFRYVRDADYKGLPHRMYERPPHEETHAQ